MFLSELIGKIFKNSVFKFKPSHTDRHSGMGVWWLSIIKLLFEQIWMVFLSCGYILVQTTEDEQQLPRKNCSILHFYAEVNTSVVLVQAEVGRVQVNGRVVSRDDLLVGLRNSLLT